MKVIKGRRNSFQREWTANTPREDSLIWRIPVFGEHHLVLRRINERKER